MTLRVAVQVFCEEGQVLRTTLGLADAWRYEIHGASPKVAAKLADWLRSYGERRQIPLPSLFDVEILSPFLQTVLKQLRNIPFGTTVSYRELATMCGNPRSARAAGSGCGRNPFPLFYPCHRVVHSSGQIGGFALDLEVKRRLLAFEGAIQPLSQKEQALPARRSPLLT